MQRSRYSRFKWHGGYSASWQSLLITARPLVKLDCSICCCMLPLDRDSREVCSAVCGHRHHVACLRMWYYQFRRGNESCPLCVNEFAARDIFLETEEEEELWDEVVNSE